MAEILILSLLALAIALYQSLRPADRKRIEYAFSPRDKLVVFLSLSLIVVLYLIGRYIQTANPSFSLFCDTICLPALFWVDVLQVAAVGVIFYVGKKTLVDDPPQVDDGDSLATVLRDLHTGKRHNVLLRITEDNFGYLFESGNGNQSSQIVIERALLSDEVATELATTNPDLGLRIISNDSDWFPRKEFAERFLRSLHKDQSSILYREIRNNRNGEYDNYSIEAGNELLDTLFSDCSVAQELLVWKPIGDRTIELLKQKREEESDEYNNRNEKFSISHERVIFRDPVFMSIRYFNIMLVQGLRNDVDSHMWVSYMEAFTEQICKNFQDVPQVNSPDEFVNDYHYLLDNIFETLSSMIENVTNHHRPSYSNMQSPDTTAEADIIKMSIWTLLLCYKHVIESSAISSEAQRMLSKKVFDCYLELAGSNTSLSDDYHASMHAFFVNNSSMNPVAGGGFSQFQREALYDLQSYDTISIHNPDKMQAYTDLESDLS